MSEIDVLLSNMDKHTVAKTQYRVGFLLLDEFALMSYASAVEPLRAANLLADEPLYTIRHLPAHGASAVSSSGAMVRADAFLGERVDFDLVIVVAGGDPAKVNHPRLFEWLRLLAQRGVLIGGVSGGPVILAKAGLMAQRRMTVHWEHAEALSVLSPDVVVERSLYVIDRDRMTCAGGTAALDMMHALITTQHGGDFARKVSDWFLHTDIRPSEGPQRSGLSERYNVSHRTILLAIESMDNHIADPLELDQIARIVGISARQLNRLFSEKLGVSTVRFYRKLRLLKAQQLLQQSSLSISEIATATGFSNPAHFSRQFSSVFNKAPSMSRQGILQ